MFSYALAVPREKLGSGRPNAVPLGFERRPKTRILIIANKEPSYVLITPTERRLAAGEE